MQFGALTGLPHDLEEVLSEAQIDPSAAHWMDVKDFNWLKATPSPHWRPISLENAEGFPVDE